jgi:hypothetical protein
MAAANAPQVGATFALLPRQPHHPLPLADVNAH